MQLLYHLGVDVNRASNPIHDAVGEKHVSTLRLLVNLRSSVDASGAHGATPLIFAIAKHGDERTCKILIELRADVEAKDQHGHHDEGQRSR